MSLQIWNFPFLCWLDCDDDHIYSAILAGDERNSIGFHVYGVEAALVLAQVCLREGVAYWETLAQQI